MEAFTLLKYWRGKGEPKPTTTMAALCNPPAETDDDGDDDGSFFDLEFTVPADGDHGGSAEEEEADEEEEGREFTIALPSSDDGGGASVSPTDDLFFKGRLVPIETSSSSPSLVLATTEATSDTKPHQFPVSLLKSATKLRILMLSFKKPRSTAAEPNGTAAVSSPKSHEQQSKFFVKFKIEEVPIMSLFTRDNSSRSNSSSGRAAKPPPEDAAAAAAEAEERRFVRDVVQRYINKVKPLYVRASKKYAEKLKFSAQLISFKGEQDKPGTATTGDGDCGGGGGNVEKPEGGSLPAGLRVVCKRLGKSRSASLIEAVRSPSAAAPPPPPKRRDDSLIQQQDGIQSAIAHCKRSFHASDSDGSESPLVRSNSNRGNERSDKA